MGDGTDQLGQVAVILRVAVAEGEDLGPAVRGRIGPDLIPVQLRDAAGDVEEEVETALPFEQTAFGLRVQEREGEELGDEDGGVEAVEVEEVELDLLGGPLGGAGVVDWTPSTKP